MYRSTLVLTAGVVLAALPACADQNPTSPDPESATAPLAASPEPAMLERAQLAAALIDAETRLVVGLSDARGAATLGGALATLRRSLASGSGARADGLAADARKALDAYEAGAARLSGADAGPDAADLTAIRLVLDRMDALATASTATP